MNFGKTQQGQKLRAAGSNLGDALEPSAKKKYLLGETPPNSLPSSPKLNDPSHILGMQRGQTVLLKTHYSVYRHSRLNIVPLCGVNHLAESDFWLSSPVPRSPRRTSRTTALCVSSRSSLRFSHFLPSPPPSPCTSPKGAPWIKARPGTSLLCNWSRGHTPPSRGNPRVYF